MALLVEVDEDLAYTPDKATQPKRNPPILPDPRSYHTGSRHAKKKTNRLQLELTRTKLDATQAVEHVTQFSEGAALTWWSNLQFQVKKGPLGPLLTFALGGY
jgi:hypothetical protein